MKIENNIDRYFRENLYDFRVKPPEGMWEDIEQDLKKNSRRIIIPAYIKVAAGIILLASLASILWRISIKQETLQPEVVSEKIETTVKITKETEAAKIIGKENSEKQVIQSNRSESSVESYQTPAIAEASVLAEDPEVLLPVEALEGQQDIETVTTLIEPDFQTAFIESNNETDPSVESPSSLLEEPKETVTKNDLIIQQNVMVLNESSEESIAKTGRWSIGGQAGPQYSYRDVSVNPDYKNSQDYNKFEEGMLAFAGGVNVQLQAAKRFSIQSGVYYSKIGQEVSSIVYGNNNVPTDVVADEPNVPTSIGTLSKDNRQQAPEVAYSDNMNISQGSFYTEQHFEFVEIPLVLKYFVVDRKLDISINGGLWTNILVGNTAVTTGNDNYRVEEETNDINTFNYSGSLGVGFNYPVTSNLLISLDPIFKYYLSPINSNPETEVHPYTFGIMTGINFSF